MKEMSQQAKGQMVQVNNQGDVYNQKSDDEAVCSTNITPSKYSRALIDFYETEDCEEKVVEWICSCLSERSEKEEEQQNSPTHKAA